MVQTSLRLTLLVKSKTCGQAVLHPTFGGQTNRGHASGETYSHGVRDWPRRLNQQNLCMSLHLLSMDKQSRGREKQAWGDAWGLPGRRRILLWQTAIRFPRQNATQ
jgi:hypothetical protein